MSESERESTPPPETIQGLETREAVLALRRQDATVLTAAVPFALRLPQVQCWIRRVAQAVGPLDPQAAAAYLVCQAASELALDLELEVPGHRRQLRSLAQALQHKLTKAFIRSRLVELAFEQQTPVASQCLKRLLEARQVHQGLQDSAAKYGDLRAERSAFVRHLCVKGIEALLDTQADLDDGGTGPQPLPDLLEQSMVRQRVCELHLAFALARKDSTAWNHYVSALEPQLTRELRRLGCRRVEDVLASLRERLVRNVALQFQGGSSLKTYLENQLKNQLKRPDQRDRDVPFDEATAEAPRRPSPLERANFAGPGFAALLSCWTRAFDSLTNRQLELLAAIYAQGLTRRAVAEQWSLHPANVGRQEQETLDVIGCRLHECLYRKGFSRQAVEDLRLELVELLDQAEFRPVLLASVREHWNRVQERQT